MINLPITSLFAACFAVALVALSIPISLRRVKIGVMIGHSEDEVLLNRIRAHGNFVEYVPLGLMLLGLAEVQGVADVLLCLGGISLALGRLLHVVGTYRPADKTRGLGMAFTYLSLVSTAVLLCESAWPG